MPKLLYAKKKSGYEIRVYTVRTLQQQQKCTNFLKIINCTQILRLGPIVLQTFPIERAYVLLYIINEKINLINSPLRIIIVRK